MKSNIKSYITLGLCTLECLIFGGTFFGWPFLAYVYKDLGFFSCNSNLTSQAVNITQPCPDQDVYMPLAMYVGLAALGLEAVPVGWLFQRYGLRVVRCLAVLTGAGGSLVLAFATNMNPFIIYLGTFLVVAAFGMMLFSNHHVALLAGEKAPIINVLNSGAVRSGFVLFIVKLAYDHGYSQRWSLVVLACLWTLVILTTFLLLPPYKVDHGEGESAKKSRSIRHPMSSKRSVRGFMADAQNTLKFLTGPAIQQEGKETEKEPIPHDTVESIWYYLKSPTYIMHLLYINILYTWNSIITGILNVWLSDIYKGDQVLVSNATNVYGYIQIAIGLLFAPVNAVLINSVKSCLIRTGNMPNDAPAAMRVVVTAPTLILASFNYAMAAICMLLPLPASPYLLFVFTDMAKALIAISTLSVLLIMFPMEHFAVLFGLLVSVSALGLPIQYGYLRSVQASGFTQPTYVILALVALTLIHPIIIIINYFRERGRHVMDRATSGTDAETDQATALSPSM